MRIPFFTLVGCLALLLNLSSPGSGATLTGGDVAAAVAAIRSEHPTPAQKKVVDLVLATMLKEHHQKLGLTGSQITPQANERLNQVSRLTLMTVAAMTAHDPSAARQFSLEDLMAISGAVMKTLRDMKVDSRDLQNRTFVLDTLIPQVIEELAK
ncbi:MAG: hypothetical protein K6T55_03075 [Syntrophobacterales bacterium]|nr:hypothetical protein [Syntrophobacterales bacterium]